RSRFTLVDPGPTLNPQHVSKRNILRAAASLAAFFGAVLVVASCADLTGTTGVGDGIVAIAYKGPPTADTSGKIYVNIGDTIAPAFEVTLNSKPRPTARYVFELNQADSAQTPNAVFDVIEGGERIVIKGRGNATLWARLLGATIGADSIFEASIVVNATPASS